MPAAPDTSPHDDPDDALSDAIADALVELARVPGPHRLAVMRMAGLAPQQGPVPQRILGLAFGISRARIGQIEEGACLKLRHRLPELKQLRP